MRARDNPFRVECIEALPFRRPGFTWDTFFERFEASGRRGAIVGNHGSGKTTFVEELTSKLAARGATVNQLRLNQDDRPVSMLRIERWLLNTRTEDILILDGSEQLNAAEWRLFQTLSAAHRGLLITQHRPARLDTLLHCETSVQLLHELVQELAGAEIVARFDLARMFQRHRGNIRECLRELYDNL